MATKITLTYHGMDGEGPTVKEAKLDASRKIEKYLKDTEHGPHTFTTEGYVVLVYRMHNSWASRIFGPLLSGCECSGQSSKEEATRRAKYHLAQTISSIDNVRTDLCHPDDKNELTRYFDWQRRWKEFKAQGFNDNDCHKLASGWTIEQVQL